MLQWPNSYILNPPPPRARYGPHKYSLYILAWSAANGPLIFSTSCYNSAFVARAEAREKCPEAEYSADMFEADSVQDWHVLLFPYAADRPVHTRHRKQVVAGSATPSWETWPCPGQRLPWGLSTWISSSPSPCPAAPLQQEPGLHCMYDARWPGPWRLVNEVVNWAALSGLNPSPSRKLRAPSAKRLTISFTRDLNRSGPRDKFPLLPADACRLNRSGLRPRQPGFLALRLKPYSF